MSLEKKILEREKELKYKTDRLGAGSLMTLSSKVNSSRQIMLNHHMGHAVNIKDPEFPLVSTGFETVMAQFSSMLKKADTDYKVIEKIEKNRYTYLLILYSEKSKKYHAVLREEFQEQSEEFATRYKNSFLDGLEIGDEVEKGQIIKKSESFDKYGNYCLGKNLNVVYMISVDTMEDGIKLMNGAEKMMNCYRVREVIVPLNDNEIPLNLCGDKEHYQGCPGIGETIKRGIIMATRMIDHEKSPYSIKDKYLRKIEDGDKVYYSSGRVIDVIIYYNKDKSKLIDSKTNEQINNFYEAQLKYYNAVYKSLSEIVSGAEDGGYTYSDELSILYKESFDHIDSSAYFADQNDNVFGNMIIKFIVADEEPMVPGSKMVGRYGNKGVVAKILSPEESYFTESGKPIHVVLDALGVVGRLNPGQLYELALNDSAEARVEKMKALDEVFDKLLKEPNKEEIQEACDLLGKAFAADVVMKLKKSDIIDEKFNIVYDFLKIVNNDEAKAIKKYFKDLSKDEKENFIKKIEKHGINIVQDPIDNVNLYDIRKLYKEVPARMERIVFPDKSKSLKKVICAKQYFLRLKQDPIDKYSVRGRGPINPIYLLPSKSNLKKKNLEEFSDVPVKIGTSEIDVLSLCNNPEAIADFMAVHSTSPSARLDLTELYFYELETDFVLEQLSSNTKKNREMIDAYLSILGSEFEFKFKEEE